MNLKSRITKVLPEYSLLPIILMLVINVVTYNGTRLFTGGLHHYDMTLAIDRATPFVPPFFLAVYFLAYVQWVLGYAYIAKADKNVCYRLFTAEIIAKVLCFVCFVIIPTTNVRPEVLGNDIWSMGTRLLYKMDAADNLFPSIHCLESWVIFRSAFYLVAPAKWYKWISLTATLLVFASTILLKQHVVADIAGAILVVEIGMLISGKKFGNKKSTI